LLVWPKHDLECAILKDTLHTHPSGKWYEVLEQVSNGRPVKSHSGQIVPGDVFVALPGTRINGSAFVREALGKGARYIVAERLDDFPKEGQERYIAHTDPREALGELARAFYKTDSFAFTLIGITGTNGKTTVTYLVEHLLQSLGYAVGVLGTVSYRWPGWQQEAPLTTPDCLTLHKLLAEMGNNKVDAVCMEVSSHGLELHRVAGLHFDWAIFINLSQDHLDFHKDMETYFQAKAQLFYPPLTSNGAAIVNADDAYGQRLLSDLPGALGFGLECQPNGSFSCLQGTLLSSSKQGLKLAFNGCGHTWQLASGLIGKHNASNLLATQALGLQMGIDPVSFQCLSSFQGVPGRMERIPNEQGYLIFIDYAHTPDALKSVVSSLKALEGRRLVVVFGCGGDRDQEKRPLMGQAVARLADVAVVTSDNPRYEDPLRIMDDILSGFQGHSIEVIQEVDRRKAIEIALGLLAPEDILLIAGKGHERSQEINGQRYPFSDSHVVQEFLQLSEIK
jgi:UDP-N-acetylmuramoyl-L-alanyl-D-glutamate--2,6-diaminopimelate ligase